MFVVVLANLLFTCRRDLAQALESNSDLTSKLGAKNLELGDLRDARRQDEVLRDEDAVQMRKVTREKQELGVQFATLQAESEQLQAEVKDKQELVDQVATLRAEVSSLANEKEELTDRVTFLEAEERDKEAEAQQAQDILTETVRAKEELSQRLDRAEMKETMREFAERSHKEVTPAPCPEPEPPPPCPPCPPCESSRASVATLLSQAVAAGGEGASCLVGNVSRAIEFAEARYWYQRGESRQQLNPVFARYGANWPCLWGEELVGRGEGDGLKWMCGAQLLTKPCVVYSFGSRGNIDFELGILDLHPHCEVHVFDPTYHRPAHAPREMNYDEVGLAAKSGASRLQGPHADTDGQEGGIFRVRSLADIMRKKKHTHVDVLKIDIETMEFEVMEGLAKDGWPSVGQLLVEVHLEQQGHGGTDAQHLFSSIEKADFRLFHHEPNWEFGASCCIEYSFIQRDYDPATRHYSMLSPPYHEKSFQTYPMPQNLVDKYLSGNESFISLS